MPPGLGVLTHKWSSLFPFPWLLRMVSQASFLYPCLSTAAAVCTGHCRRSVDEGKVHVSLQTSFPGRASVREWGKLGSNVHPKAS